MRLNLKKLNGNWADLRAFLQHKMQVLGEVKQGHEEEVETYKEYCDYLEPGSLKEKLVASIQKLDKATRNLDRPVDELRKKRDLLLAKRDREVQNCDEMERKN